MNIQSKRSLPFLLAALLLASCAQTLPAQTQSQSSTGSLSDTVRNNWGKIVLAAILCMGYMVYRQDVQNNQYALMRAINENDPATFQACLSKLSAADINDSIVHTRHGFLRVQETPLQAALGQNTEFAKKLLVKGAIPSKVFEHRSSWKQEEFVEAFVSDNELLSLALKRGLNPNFEYPRWIQSSISKRNRESVHILLRRGFPEPKEVHWFNREFWNEALLYHKNKCLEEKKNRLAGLASIKNNGVLDSALVRAEIIQCLDLKSTINFSASSVNTRNAYKRGAQAHPIQAIA